MDACSAPHDNATQRTGPVIEQRGPIVVRRKHRISLSDGRLGRNY